MSDTNGADSTFLYFGSTPSSTEEGEFSMTYRASESNEDISQLIADMMILSPEVVKTIGDAILIYNEEADLAREAIIEEELGLTFQDEEEYED